MVREDPADAAGLVKALEDEGFSVHEVDIPDAVPAMKAGDYGLVVAFPRSAAGGIFPLRELSGGPGKGEAPPVLLMAAAECEFSRYLAWLEEGMGYFIPFPIDKRHFLSIVGDILSRPSQGDDGPGMRLRTGVPVLQTAGGPGSHGLSGGQAFLVNPFYGDF